MGTQERNRITPPAVGPTNESGHHAHAALRATARHVGNEGDRIIDGLLSSDSETFGRQGRQQSGE